jgi:hypothetical protein
VSEQTAGTMPAAGWYPEPGSVPGSTLRWWDGASWTDQVRTAEAAYPLAVPDGAGDGDAPGADVASASAPGAAVAAGPGAPAPSPTAGSQRWGTLWVWLLAASPWLTFVPGLFAFHSFITYSAPEWHWMVLVLVPYLLVVGMAIFDVKQLRQWHTGVAHWTWSLLGAPIYLIARYVVLRRRGVVGSAPMWVALANVLTAVLVVVALLAVIAWIVLQLSISMSS